MPLSYPPASGGGGAVESVNGETGVVSLSAADVGAAATTHSHATSDVTDLAEFTRDTIGTALVAGTNVSIDVNDASNTITLSATGDSSIVPLTQAEWDLINPGDPDLYYFILEDEGGGPPPFTWLATDEFAATEAPPAILDTGQNWRVEVGTWSQASGGISATTTEGAIIVTDVGSNVQTGEFVVGGTLPSSGIPTLVLCYDNTNDYHYRFEKYNTSEFRLIRRDPGATTIWTSGTGAAPGGAGVKIRVAVSGSTGARQFRLWVNDSEVTQTATGSLLDTDSTPPMGTEIGFRYAFTSSGNQYTYTQFKADDSVVVP